jgi:tetratricopeptide (TPR) repeat protein
MFHLGYPENYLPILQEGEMLSKELGDNRGLAILYGRIGSYYAYIGEPLIGIKYAENAFEEGQKIQDIELMAPVAFELCAPYMGAGEFLKTVDVAISVLNLIEKSKRESDFFGKDMNVYSALCARCGGSMAYLGNFQEAEIILEKGLLNATKIGDTRALAAVELYFGHTFLFKGVWGLAKEHYQNCIKYSEEMKWTMLLGLAWSGLGHVYTFLGDPETARKNIEKGLKIQNDAGIEWWLSLHYGFLSLACFDLGDQKGALCFIEEALELSQKNNEKMMEGLSWVWLGRISGKAVSLKKDGAEEYILKGIKILDKLKLKALYSQGYLFLGELYVNSGQREKALENLEKVEEMFQEMGMDYWLARTQEVLKAL